MVLTINGATNSRGVYLNHADNCTVDANFIQGNHHSILLNHSSGNIITNNQIINSYYGVYSEYSDDTVIFGNSISDNDCGICLAHADDIQILENNLTYNECGIYLHESSGEIHFNRISDNEYYGLYSEYSMGINASNNWWGYNTPLVSSTTPCDICTVNGSVTFDPWIVLGVKPTSYKVSDGKIYESTITADLTHNSDDEDLSLLGHVPDGTPVSFFSQYGTITNPLYTRNGKASSTLVLNPNVQSVTGVFAIVDDSIVYTEVECFAQAIIAVSSLAIDTSTNEYLNFTYTVPLNDPTAWISVLWKETGLFQAEIDLIVNGNVVVSKDVVNAAYLTYQSSYSAEVFNQIRYINYLFLNPVESTTFVPNQYLQTIIDYYHLEDYTVTELEDFVLLLIKQQYNFTNNEINFIKNNRRYFVDFVAFGMSYPGDAAQAISFIDPDNNETVNLKLPGNPIQRVSPMIYFDGYSEDANGNLYSVGYEGIRSFAIATTKVTNVDVEYWLDRASLYQPGAMKAAYGTFLTALLVEYVHDQLADAVATEFNVTWTRTHPIAVSVGDDAYQTFRPYVLAWGEGCLISFLVIHKIKLCSVTWG